MDAVKTVANLQARGSSIILNLESDKWETRANTLDTLPPEEVEQNVMLVLERVEDEDKSVRCAAVEALLRLNARFPRVMARHSKFIALKLQNNSRAIQLLALELLVELHPTELRRYLKKARSLKISYEMDDAHDGLRRALEEMKAGVRRRHCQRTVKTRRQTIRCSNSSYLSWCHDQSLGIIEVVSNL